MRTGLTAIAVLLGILGAAGTASAQETSSSAEAFGRRASNIIVLDDVLGYADHTFKVEDEEGEEHDADPLLTSGTGFFPSRVIQLGYHYSMDGLTVGSGLGFWYAKASSEDDDDDSGSLLHLEVRPRIGYIVPLAKAFAFWPRAGVGYLRRSTSSGDEDENYWGASADVDLLAVITPAPHFGITAGLKFAFPLAGGYSAGDLDASYSMTSLALGLLTDF